MFPGCLRVLRKGQKITLKELAIRLNENFGPNERPNTALQIGNWGHGIRTPSYVKTRKLAEFFGVSLDYLTGKTDRDDFDLTKLSFSSKNPPFNQTVLSSDDRYETLRLTDGYSEGRHNRRNTDIFYGKQK